MTSRFESASTPASPFPMVRLIDAWRDAPARQFFRNVWPMYVHELSGFDTNFYTLSAGGRWLPDIVEDWISTPTPAENLRDPRAARDPAQPFQRAYVVASDSRPVGFLCTGRGPFKYMPADVDFCIAESFLIHTARGIGVAQAALGLVLERDPGRWFLRVIHDNTRAIRFWRKALARAEVREVDEGHESGAVTFRFVAGDAKAGQAPA